MAGLVSVIGFASTWDRVHRRVPGRLAACRPAASWRGGRGRRSARPSEPSPGVLHPCRVRDHRRHASAALSTAQRPDASPIALVLLTTSAVVMPFWQPRSGAWACTAGQPHPRRRRRDLDLRPAEHLPPSRRGSACSSDRRRVARDPAAGLMIIAAFAIHEGREAWEGELVEDDDPLTSETRRHGGTPACTSSASPSRLRCSDLGAPSRPPAVQGSAARPGPSAVGRGPVRRRAGPDRARSHPCGGHRHRARSTPAGRCRMGRAGRGAHRIRHSGPGPKEGWQPPGASGGSHRAHRPDHRWPVRHRPATRSSPPCPQPRQVVVATRPC